MPRFFRYVFLFLMIAALAIIGALFGSYPSTGIPQDTVLISVSRSASENPIFELTDPDDLRVAKEAAGTIWNHIGYNSMDSPELYRLTLTSSDGQSRSFWVSQTEWADHGKTPRGFFGFLRQMESEKNVVPPDEGIRPD